MELASEASCDSMMSGSLPVGVGTGKSRWGDGVCVHVRVHARALYLIHISKFGRLQIQYIQY